MIRRVDELEIGDVLLLGPCEPEFKIKSIGREGPFYVIRARPSYETGEEGADGCEQFDGLAEDVWQIKRKENR